MRWKKDFIILSCFCLSLLPSCSSAAEITTEELNLLNSKLIQQESLIQESKAELNTLRIQLQKSKAELQILKRELSLSKESLQKQNESIENANSLLKQYEEEQKKKIRRIKRQRTIAWVVAGSILLANIK